MHPSALLICLQCPCSVAVLDGGYPAWLAERLEIDKAHQSEDQIEAGARAAQNPPASTSYQAQLQVDFHSHLQLYPQQRSESILLMHAEKCMHLALAAIKIIYRKLTGHEQR